MSSFTQRIARAHAVRAAYWRIGLPLLRWQPLPSTVLGPVKGTHASLEEWIEEHGEAVPAENGAPLHWVAKIAPPCPRRNPDPLVALPRVPQNFDDNVTYQVPAAYVGHLHWGRIATRQFEVIAPDDRVFNDLFWAGPNDYNPAQSLILPWLPRVQAKPGTYVTIGTGRAANYYHWLNDCLPRLSLLEGQVKNDFKLIVPANPAPFHQQTLELLGFPPERQAAFGQEHWAVEHLLTPSLVTAPAQSSPAAGHWLREKILGALKPTAKAFPKRVYVSRALATKRRLLNEADIAALLVRHGFTTVQTETMSVEDQARLFEGAEVVAAPHGAGLTNAVFMHPGALLLELLHYRKAKTCYVSLAGAMDLRYACVTDEPEDNRERLVGPQPETDFTIPLERVRLALKKLAL